MDFLQSIQTFKGQPLTHQMIVSALKGYKRPNDKIHELLTAGVLISIRKGLYVAADLTRPEPFLLANHVFGPSYVSTDSALSTYGLIPERVYELTSVTPKASQRFETPAGSFTYAHLPLPYYSFGLVQKELAAGQRALVASPEKALLDKLITTSGMILRSRTAAAKYLLENLRLDESQVKDLNLVLMEEWLPYTPKKESVRMLIQTIQNL